MGIQQEMMDFDWTSWKSTEPNYARYAHVKSNRICGDHLETTTGQRPDTTIMILTYRRPQTLRQALDSALNQEYAGTYEIIISDDSGRDPADYGATEALAREYCEKHTNIVYYRHERNLGQYANWNRAVELCRTEWGALLHDDDRLYPNYLKQMLEASRQCPEAGLIGSMFDSTEHPSGGIVRLMMRAFRGVRRGRPIKLDIVDSRNFIFPLCPGMFVNREKYLAVGGLDDIGADLGFCSRMTYYHQSVLLPIVLSDNGTAGGSSLSCSQEICNTFLISAYKLVFAICQDLGYSQRACMKYASRAALYGEVAARGYNAVDYTDIKKSLGLPDAMCRPMAVGIENLRSKLLWGLLLLRR